MKERRHLEVQGLGTWEDNFTANFKVVGYILVAQDNNTWQNYLNTMMNLLATKHEENFFTD